MAYDFNPFTGQVDDKGKTLATLDLRYLKLTGSLAEVSNHSHTVLTDIGTNTHAQIDTFIGTTVPATYLPLAGGTMTGGIINSTSIDPLTTLAESWIGPSTTTGIYFKGGNVGIGVTAPTYRLDVKGTTNVSTQLLRLLDNDNTSMFEVKQDASGNALAYLRDTNEAALIALTTSGSSYFTGGNVGIGTTEPGAKLEVDQTGSGNFAAIIQGTKQAGHGIDDGRILLVNDDTAMAAGVGGVIGFQGKFTTAGNMGLMASIELEKADGVSGNLGGNLFFGTRPLNGDATAKRMVIDSTGNVGIGTTNPLAKLQVASGIGTMPALLAGDVAVIQNNANTTDVARLAIIGGTSGYSTIFFGDADYNRKGQIIYDHSTEKMQFVTNDNTNMTIDTSGNVGIGVTGPTAVLHLKAGTATANTAPLKFNSGTLNTAAEAGAMEFLTDALYFTITTGAARKTIAFLESPSFTTPTLGAATCTTLSVAGNQVVGTRVVDARIDDTPNSGDATTDGIIAAIQSILQTHGLAAAA